MARRGDFESVALGVRLAHDDTKQNPASFRRPGFFEKVEAEG